jgi:hypothetical protein
MNKRISESKTVGSVIVHKFSVAGMSVPVVCYVAYEASSYFGNHSTLFTIDGQVCGSLTSRRIGAEIEALKGGSPARLAACDAFRKANATEAYAAILAAYPEAVDGNRDNGEIEIVG